MENPQQPIYPMPYQNQDGTIQHDVYFGLTKLEYFSGLAMQGMLVNVNGAFNYKNLVKNAIDLSKELLKQLNEQK